MTRSSAALATILSAILSTGAALAADDPIKARKDLMKANGDALKSIVAVIKGEKPYDAADAAKTMTDINKSLVTFLTLFPKGSETGGETAAKPEIWTDRAGFEAKAKDLENATVKAAAAAPGGLDSFKAAFGDVGKACKGCHEEFRVKKQ